MKRLLPCLLLVLLAVPADAKVTRYLTGTAADVVVPAGVSAIRIQVVRRGPPETKNNKKSESMDEVPLDATAWVDAVTLSRVGSTPR